MTRDAAIGAGLLENGGCRFHVWAPRAERVAVRVGDDAPRLARLEAGEAGYFTGELDGVAPQAGHLVQGFAVTRDCVPTRNHIAP